MRDTNLEEMEFLTKRFKDYIDKFQLTLEKVDPILPEPDSTGGDPSCKFYTVVSPVDVMTDNMKSVLNVLEEAITTIEKISNTSAEELFKIAEESVNKGKKNKPGPAPQGKVLLTEELDFLEKTFNKILHSSARERSRISEELDKISNS